VLPLAPILAALTRADDPISPLPPRVHTVRSITAKEGCAMGNRDRQRKEPKKPKQPKKPAPK
jgi:hypothetical protein